MPRLPSLFSIAAYGILRGIFLSVLCWAVVMGVYSAWATIAPGPEAGLGAVLFNFVYGGFLGALVGIQLGLWTGTTTALAAVAVTSLLAYPLKNPERYKQIMQIVCTIVATVCTALVARGYLDPAGNPVITIPIAAFVAFRVSRYLASWAVSRSSDSRTADAVTMVE